MSELFDKSIRTLELPRVLQLLADQAVSEEAKALALAVRPETDYEDVLRLLDQTDGARTMSALHGAPGFSGGVQTCALPILLSALKYSLAICCILPDGPRSISMRIIWSQQPLIRCSCPFTATVF